MRNPGTRPSFLLIAWTVALWVIALLSFSQTTQEQLQRKKKQLEDEIKLTGTLLEQTRNSRQASLNRLQLLDQQIGKRQSLITTITREVDGIQVQIDLQNQQIKKLNTDLAKMKDEYARMIYYAYKNLNAYNRLLFIFSAKDFNQAFDRLRYYQQYSASRRTQAELIRDKQIEITRSQRELEETKAAKMALLTSQQSHITTLTTEKEEKDRTVEELTQKEKQLKASLKDKQEAARKLQNEIEKLIAAEIRVSAAKTKGTGKNEVQKGAAETGLFLTPVEMELSSSFASNKGRLPWPAEKGIITGTFGEHPHPVLKYVKTKNNGVDIATEKGASVRAVFNGKVSRVMSFPNLNKVVIIRHGEYLTVYSNLEEVYVKDGDMVTTKQVIGNVHTDPEDAKTEIHFEIWLGKTIQNPQEWLTGAN
ncbi:MAG TPA: peptidoglycan DD-metalloendopeptidase family protein [Bacteroidales bacterium]|nr:peptidoglycan DD-metalloendopeptidase family protein [Bacteroidales bacterium]